jgi:hypothetical protein
MGVEHLAQKGIQAGQVVPGNEATQPLVGQAGALEAEQFGAGKIGLEDLSAAVEGEIGQWGKIVEFGVGNRPSNPVVPGQR